MTNHRSLSRRVEFLDLALGVLSDAGEDAWLIGEIISGNGKQGYNIKFDDLPAEDQMVYVRRRNIIVVIEEGEEEVECDHVNVDLNTEASVPKKDEYK